MCAEKIIKTADEINLKMDHANVHCTIWAGLLEKFETLPKVISLREIFFQEFKTKIHKIWKVNIPSNNEELC